MSATDYGVFAELVAAAGSVMSASAAIGLTWKGRARFEPDDQDLPRGAQKVGGVVSGVAIASLWWAFTRAKVVSAPQIVELAGAAVGVLLVALVAYGIMITVYIYTKETTKDGAAAYFEKIIGGFWLTAGAKSVLRSKAAAGETLSIQDLFKGAAFDPDYVWPRISRALAKATFNIAYIFLTAAGTIALACVSLLIAGAVHS